VINDCSEYDRISKNVIRNQYNKLLSKIDRAFIKAADVVVKKIKLPKNRNEYYFTVINPLPYNRTKITGVELEIPSSLALENISIEDLSGRKLPSVLVSKSDVSPVFDHHDDIAKSRYRCYLELSNFPALGYKTFKIVPVQKSAQFRRKNIITAEHTLENDFIRVAINANGTFNIYSKETGVIYKDLGYFVDTIQTDPGNPDEIKTIKSTTLSPVISQFENSALLGSFKIEYSWSQSDNIENNRVNITIVLSLDRLSRYVDITIDIVDKALNHKIAYFFPVHFKADHIYSDIRFDLQDISPIVNIKNLDHHPMSLNSLVGLCGEIAGFAIISKEIHLAHVTTKKHPSVSLPIIDKIAHQSIPPKGNNTAILKYHLSFYPYIGGWENGQILYDAYNRLFEMKSFMIGETDGSLPSQMEFIKIKPSNLCFSVLKTSETGNVILRFFNPTVKFIDGSIVSHYPLISAKVMSLEEYIIDTLELKDEHEITLLVPPKKIMTIELRMRCKEKNAA